MPLLSAISNSDGPLGHQASGARQRVPGQLAQWRRLRWRAVLTRGPVRMSLARSGAGKQSRGASFWNPESIAAADA